MEMITHPVLLTEAVAVIKQHNKNWEVYSFADAHHIPPGWLEATVNNHHEIL